MLAIFCLRLACGLIGSLVLFSPRLVNPRFYRVHFLTTLGLTAVAVVLLREMSGVWVWTAGASMILAFVGSLVWSLEGTPGGRILIGLTFAALVGTLGWAGQSRLEQLEAERAKVRWAPAPASTPCDKCLRAGCLADDLTSAALLGTATTAMLMGHSYLIAPGMSLTPLLHLLAGLFGALLLRLGLAGAGLWFWTARHSLLNLEDETVLWLPLRWAVGLAAPLVLGWMARESARIRSTQSATGILYVVVICCFLGELTSQLLFRNTGSFL
jgi:hypothetical protein